MSKLLKKALFFCFRGDRLFWKRFPRISPRIFWFFAWLLFFAVLNLRQTKFRASGQGGSTMPIFSIAKIFYVFCIFCIPYTGCLFKHALESKLSSIVSVLDQFRHNYVYRPPKTFRKAFLTCSEIWSTKIQKSIDSINFFDRWCFWQPVYQFLKTLSEGFQSVPFLCALSDLKPWTVLVFGVLLRGSCRIMYKALSECQFFGFLAFLVILG